MSLLSRNKYLGSSGGSRIRVEGFVGAASWGHIVIIAEVDIDESVSRSVRANQPGIGLGPGDIRIGPLEAVSTEDEGTVSSTSGSLGPRHQKFGHSGVRRTRDNGIKWCSVGVLNKLSVCDLELGCSSR